MAKWRHRHATSGVDVERLFCSQFEQNVFLSYKIHSARSFMPLRLTSLGKASFSKMISVKWAKWLSLVMFLGNVSGQTYSASFTMYGSGGLLFSLQTT